MNRPRTIRALILARSLLLPVCALAATAGAGPAQHVDSLRKVKVGEKMPAYELTTTEGKVIESDALLGKVVVLIYLSAQQRGSEQAAADANRVLKKLGKADVDLLFVSADVIQRDSFQKFWEEAEIEAPLAFDPRRDLYAKLGLIVFPTTIVIDRDGRLAHVISTRRNDYPEALSAYIRHALGEIDDAKLTEELTAKAFDRGSPKSRASRHRAAARLLRGKGLLDSAEKELQAALQLDSEDTNIQLDLADLYLAQRKIPLAEKIVQAVLEVEPKHRRARLLEGIVLFEKGQLDEAEAVLIEALVLNPDPARTHYYLGRIYEQKGDKDKAIQHYREAIARLLET